ncbi:hypothetical protein HGB13_04450 [bacterium]|nr:hypothetical protein [bacterium]
MRQVELNAPKELDLYLILDNRSTHKTEDVTKWFAKHPRTKLHLTPTSALWLNAVKNWFSKLERQALYRGVFCSVNDLKDAIHRFLKTHNEKLVNPFIWTKKASTILDSVQRAKDALIETIY